MTDKMADDHVNEKADAKTRPSKAGGSKKGELTLVFFQAAMQSDDVSRLVS
jgi:hypothetical protein